SFGDWVGQGLEMDPRTFALTGCRSYAIRSYVNRRTGETIEVTIVCGRPGPASIHTPDVCFRGAGFELAGEPSAWTVTSSKEESPFQAALFHRSQASGALDLRVLWSWSAPGAWQAPENPRIAFASQPALFKLYVIRQMLRDDEPLAEDPCNAFIRAF